MASTLKAERNAVRARLNDLNFGNAILQSDLVDAAIQDIYGMMVNDGLSDSAWGNFITLSEDINEYLGGVAEYALIRAVRYVDATAEGALLTRVDPEKIKGWIGGGADQGVPRFYALAPSGGPTVMFVYPTPGPSENGKQLDLYQDVGVAALVLDTDGIGLSRTGLSALRELAAAKIARNLGPKMLEKLDLPASAWQDMKATGERLLYSEKYRVARQLDASHIPCQVVD